jgi:hypothetical protein
MKLVSTDNHIIEPADLWTSRLPTRYVESGAEALTDE